MYTLTEQKTVVTGRILLFASCWRSEFSPIKFSAQTIDNNFDGENTDLTFMASF